MINPNRYGVLWSELNCECHLSEVRHHPSRCGKCVARDQVDALVEDKLRQMLELVRKEDLVIDKLLKEESTELRYFVGDMTFLVRLNQFRRYPNPKEEIRSEAF